MLPFDDAALAHHRRLVQRMAQGDAVALRELYDLLVERVHQIVRHILPDAEEAREAVQDTFIKAWHRAGLYRPERGEAIAWLTLIARHVAIDRVRRQARQHALLARLPEPETESPAEPAVDDFDRHELLAQPLAQLSAAQRRALELAFFGGCSQVEIAAAMQTPVGNVKNHLRRGLLKLRQLVTRDA